MSTQYSEYVYTQINMPVSFSSVKLLGWGAESCNLVIVFLIIEFALNIWQTDALLIQFGSYTLSDLYQMFHLCVSASRDKEDINDNFIYLITSGRFDKKEN